MDPILHAMSVVKEQVQDIEERYERYHVDLIDKLAEIISKQDAGLSANRRRREVSEIINSFGNYVAVQNQE